MDFCRKAAKGVRERMACRTAASVGYRRTYWTGSVPTAEEQWSPDEREQRRASDVTRTSNEGSRGLIRAASERGAEQLRGRRLTPEQVERRRRTVHKLNLGRYLPKGYHGPCWTKAEVELLGRVPDEEVARRTGRTVDAERQKREKLARGRRSTHK